MLLPNWKRCVAGLCAIVGLPFAVDGVGRPPVRVVVTIPEEVSFDLADLPQAQTEWIRMIRETKRSLDIAQFYVFNEPGKALEPVLAELESAGKRGVAIRFLVSATFLANDTAGLERLRAMPNLELRVLDMAAINDGALHAKYWIVDGETIYVGSQNMDWRSLSQVMETGLEIGEPLLARKLKQIFDADWSAAANEAAPSVAELGSDSTPAIAGDLELVASPPAWNPPGVRAAETALVELLRSARRSIRIQVLSYGTVSERSRYWPVLDQALRTAAVRGVKVQLLVSHWNTSSPQIDHLKSLSLVPNIEVRVVTLPEHSSGFIPFARVIHSKVLVVDSDVLWVGTSNWSSSYFEKQRNIEIIARRPSLAETGARIHDALWRSPYAAPIDVNKEYPRPRRG